MRKIAYGAKHYWGLQMYSDCAEGELNSILRKATSYLITLSALASTLGGIVRPISRAVRRLTTK
jgi:hypothetical protein